MRTILRFFAVLLAAAAPSALADDEPTFNGGANLAWWSNNFSANGLDQSFDAGSFGGDAELWMRQRWGIKGSRFKSDLAESNSPRGADFSSFDVKRRLVSVTRNSFVALGLGWENIELGDGSDTQGPRLLVEGRVALTPLVTLYGYTAWLPELQDRAELEDPDGVEIEAGVAINPLPHLSLRAGYREFRLDFRSLEGANDSVKSTGVMVGAGVNF